MRSPFYLSVLLAAHVLPWVRVTLSSKPVVGRLYSAVCSTCSKLMKTYDTSVYLLQARNIAVPANTAPATVMTKTGKTWCVVCVCEDDFKNVISVFSFEHTAGCFPSWLTNDILQTNTHSLNSHVRSRDNRQSNFACMEDCAQFLNDVPAPQDVSAVCEGVARFLSLVACKGRPLVLITVRYTQFAMDLLLLPTD